MASHLASVCERCDGDGELLTRDPNVQIPCPDCTAEPPDIMDLAKERKVDRE